MNKVEVSKRSISLLRVMLSGIFLVAGVNHVAFPGHVATRLMESAVYQSGLYFMNAGILVVATGVGLLAGGILLLLNRYTRQAAILLLLLIIPITISVQLQGWSTSGPLFKNVAIAGGLLFFILNDFKSKELKEYESEA
jgi:putative oxidoreductase